MRRGLGPRCVPQLFLGLLRGTRPSAFGQVFSFFFSFLFFFFKSKLTVPEVNWTQFPVANCLLSSAKETSKFTQQEGKKKRTAKRLCMTNVTGLLLASFVVIFTYH